MVGVSLTLIFAERLVTTVHHGNIGDDKMFCFPKELTENKLHSLTLS